MRRVYHHFTDPSAINASLHDALTPGGRLVIIEFNPDGPARLLTSLGVTQAALVEQVTAAGFDTVATGKWPRWEDYVAVFKRSAH